MPRYYFHVQDGEDYRDLQGTLFDTMEEVRLEAVRFAGDLLSHNGAKFWNGEEWSMQVTDAMDRKLFMFKFVAVEATTTLDAVNDKTVEK